MRSRYPDSVELGAHHLAAWNPGRITANESHLVLRVLAGSQEAAHALFELRWATDWDGLLSRGRPNARRTSGFRIR